MASGATEHPEELNIIYKWYRFFRVHFSLPDWSTGCFLVAGGVAVFALVPRGRIGVFLDAVWPTPAAVPNWLPWWRSVLLIVVVVFLLAGLALKRRGDVKVAKLRLRLKQINNLLLITGVDISRFTATRCNIICSFQFIPSDESKHPPSTIYMGTQIDGSQHMLHYNQNKGIYEGGADANAFDEAIKDLMDIVGAVPAGAHFFTAVISCRDPDRKCRLVGTKDDAFHLIAHYNTNPFSMLEQQ